MLLRHFGDVKGTEKPFFTQKLVSGARTKTVAGWIEHASVIGKCPKDTVQTTKGLEFKLFEPSLAEYILRTNRLVTPVGYLPECDLNRY